MRRTPSGNPSPITSCRQGSSGSDLALVSGCALGLTREGTTSRKLEVFTFSSLGLSFDDGAVRSALQHESSACTNVCDMRLGVYVIEEGLRILNCNLSQNVYG